MSYRGAPKLYPLNPKANFSQFEAWRQNILYHLEEDSKFESYISPGNTWKKVTAGNRFRGFTDDAVGAENRQSKEKKNSAVERMLNIIANYCTHITRTILVKQTTSLDDVWNKIRTHHHIEATGANFLNLSTIKMEADDSYEDVYQRLYAFFDDSLMTKNGHITHHGEPVDDDELMTPTLENTITWLWLSLINPGLPQLVQQKYGAELRNKSLASLKSEVSQALPSLIDELSTVAETHVFRSSMRNFNKFNKSFTDARSTKKFSPNCSLCKAAGRSASGHWIQDCRHLPESDRRALSRARAVQETIDDDDSNDEVPERSNIDDMFLDNPGAVVRRVSSRPSPILNTLYQGCPCSITLDSGATSNLISLSMAKRLNVKIHPATQKAHQADGFTPLDTVGEVHITVTRGSDVFIFDGLVIKNLDVDILGSMPFLEDNDIGMRPAKREIIIKGKYKIPYNHDTFGSDSNAVRRSQSYVLHSPKQRTVVLPGESLCLKTPEYTSPDCVWALEPRAESAGGIDWFDPQEVHSVNHEIYLKNQTHEPVMLNKQAHVCQVRAIVDTVRNKELDQSLEDPAENCSSKSSCNNGILHSSSIILDPDNILPEGVAKKFTDLHRQYDNVFNPKIPKYNGFSGNIEGNVNMGRVLPPQRKARTPQYNREKLILLQNKFDELEKEGVFGKPEDIGLTAEYLNMSFLVPKPNKTDFRLVTSFGEVGQFSRPQPSLMPNVNDTIRDIGRWKYLIKTDLQKAYYQIPLSKSSMRFCGTATPFKGVRVYTRCAMGMPGSETALEELMNRVLGKFIQEGNTSKLADDLYVGADTVSELLDVWERVLQTLAQNNLGLSGLKTVVVPLSTVILGWIWSNGTLKASSHRVAALSAADRPKTVRGLRSFIGAYKSLSRVIKGYAEIIHPLDQAVAGKKSNEDVQWDDTLSKQFKMAQDSLNDTQIIVIPRPDDLLTIVTDGATKHGLGSTLFVLRSNKLLLAGYFNAQLKVNQLLWLPCEVEALSIGSSINYFAPYLVQSKANAQLYTDNMPCVRGYKKMCRGEFSTSPRVTTFLSAASRYQINIGHISGSRIPFTDYSSRNPVECTNSTCQVCKFVTETSESVVRNMTVQDVLKGNISMPFINRTAWISMQRDCDELRRVHAHLMQGTRPSKKANKMPNVKRLLQCVTVSNDGLLVVKSQVPFQKQSERIVVPCNLAHGLLTALHIKFSHPSNYQLKQLTNRYYYALAIDKISVQVTDACDMCNALKHVPEGLIEQTSVPPPDCVGHSYALDILKRYKQLILILRESVTSFTATMLVKSEGKEDLRNGILVLCSSMKSVAARIIVRIDPGPGLASLVDDPVLETNGISLDLGRIKNVNKNPVAEKSIQEVGNEILKIAPSGGPLSDITLALATTTCNSRIRRDGLSARELWTQRDQHTGEQLPLNDREIIQSQSKSRAKNHGSSAKAKSRGKDITTGVSLSIGDLVYIKSERDKLHARDKYIVTGISKEFCKVHKFTKSQIRGKEYDMKLSELYPITSNTLSQVVLPTGGDIDSDSSDESDMHFGNDHNESDENDCMQRRYPLRTFRNPRPSYVELSDSEYD